MNILQICPDFPPYVRGGGAETFKLLADNWQLQGHKVTVITSAPVDEIRSAPYAVYPYEVFVLGLMSSPDFLHEAAYFLPFAFMQGIRLRVLLRNAARRADLIVIHSILETLPFSSLLLLRKYAEKIILTHHGISTAEHTRFLRILSNVMYNSVAKIPISRLKKIVVYSRRTREEFLSYFHGVGNFEILETPLGIDIPGFHSIFEDTQNHKAELSSWLQNDVSTEGSFILAVGRNVRIKGFDVLLNAFAQISHDFPDLNLIIGGDETEHTRQLKSMASALGLSERIKILGRLTEMQKMFLMLNCSCLVIPSRKEGYGINAVEAAVLGVPTVATRTGAHVEILDGLQHSRLVTPGSVSELSSAISSILNSDFNKPGFDTSASSKYDISSLSRVYTNNV